MKVIGIVGISLVIIASAGLIAYGMLTVNSNKIEPSPTPLPTLPPITKSVNYSVATSSADLEDAIKITVKEYEFTPSEINIPIGIKTTIEFQNKGKMIHDWVVEGTGIKTKVIRGGESDIAEFQFDKPGVYAFYCSVAGHKEAGEVGKIVVE